jgi:hypothetical protein
MAFSLVSLGFTRDKLFLWASKEMNSVAFSCAKTNVSDFLGKTGLVEWIGMNTIKLVLKLKIQI